MKLKLYIINLAHSKERRRLMEKQLKGISLPYEFIDAIWGKSYPGDIFKYAAKSGRIFTSNEIAIVLSHKKALEKGIEDNVENIIVLEDDVILNKEFSSVITDILRMVNDGDVFLLYAAFLPSQNGKLERVKLLKTKTWLLKLINDSPKLWMAAGYILKTETAKKLTTGLASVQCPMDDWLSYKERNLIKDVFVTYPFVIKHASLPSENVDEQERNGTIASWVIRNRKKVPPLFRLFIKWRQIKEYKTAHAGIQASIQK